MRAGLDFSEMATDDPFDNQAFADRIAEALKAVPSQREQAKRKGLPMSQNEFEEAVGMGPGYIARIRKGERGQSLKREWMLKMEKILGVRSEWLYAGLGPMRAQPGELPSGGRALGLFLAARFGRPQSVIDTVAARFAGDEYAGIDPMIVLTAVDEQAKIERDLEAARVSHMRAGRERGEEIERVKRRAEKAQKKAEAEAAPPKPEPKKAKRLVG